MDPAIERSPARFSDWSHGPADGGPDAARERQRVAERRRIEEEDFLPDEGPAFDDEEDDEDDEDAGGRQPPGAAGDRRKLVHRAALLIVLIVVAIYVVFPKIVGADEAVDKLGNAVWYWIVIAVGFNVLAFAAYVALFRGVLGGHA